MRSLPECLSLIHISKSALANGTTLREEAIKLGFVSGKEFDRLVRPARMTRPDS